MDGKPFSDFATGLNFKFAKASVDTKETKQITRTINYVEDGNESNVLHEPTTQSLMLEGIKHFDFNTGTYGDIQWTTQDTDTFAEVQVPQIDGYTATQSTVAAEKITSDSDNLVVTVTYKKNQTPVTPVEPSSPVTPAEPTTPIVP